MRILTIVLVGLLLEGCELLQKRMIVGEGDIDLDSFVVPLDAALHGCYVATTEQEPQGCVRFEGDNCSVTMGDCP